MKTILTNLICLGALLFIASCSTPEGGIKEKPDGVVPTGERLETFQKIMEEFPGGKDAQAEHPELFEPAAIKRVVLTKESAVYLTFISEGASLANSLGWYMYNGNSKPSDATQIQKNLLFPHISGRILNQGDRLQLGNGTFPAGTVISFFLVIDGWEGGTVHYDRETFYTDLEYNTDNKQQHVLFQQGESGDVVLAFEDINTSRNSDKDFNDVLFIVTDNTQDAAVTSFDLTNVVKL